MIKYIVITLILAAAAGVLGFTDLVVEGRYEARVACIALALLSLAGMGYRVIAGKSVHGA